MKLVNIPNYGKITLKNILLDVNGTIQFYGHVSRKTRKSIKRLKNIFNIFLISADTRGNLKEIAAKLKVKYIKITTKEITEAEAKNLELMKLGKDSTVAIGNGNNDHLMLKNSVIGILILGKEGATVKSIMNSDVVLTDFSEVSNFLLDEKIIIATLRS